MSMDKCEVAGQMLFFLNQSGLKMEQVALGFGGCAVMMGIRTHTADLDVDVPQEFYDACLAKGCGEFDSVVGPAIRYSDLVDIRPCSDATTTMIEGLRCYDSVYALEMKAKAADHPSRPPHKAIQDHTDMVYLKNLVDQGLFVAEKA